MCGIGLALLARPSAARAALAAATPGIAARGPHMHGALIDHAYRIVGEGALPDLTDAIDTGTVPTPTSSVLLHSRLATSTYRLELADAQPLTRGGVAIAHNGVVPAWPAYRDAATTSNDSEAILLALLDGATLADAVAATGLTDTPHAVIAYTPREGWVAHRLRLPLYAMTTPGALIVASRLPGAAPLPERTTNRLEHP